MSSSKQPFFLYMAYEQPHVPLFESAHWPNVSRRGLYGDVVMEMDASIGLIMDALKQYRLDNNTLVMFTSDNGAWIAPSAGDTFHDTVHVKFDYIICHP